MAIELLAFDLDGTTIVDHQYLPEPNRLALMAAAGKGVLLVPATGRMADFVPDFIKTLPGVRYLITSNGGAVIDLAEGRPVVENLIPNEKARQVQAVLDGYDVYIEYYQGGSAITRRDMPGRAHSHFGLPESKRAFVEGKSYTFTEDFSAMLRETGLCPEKINLPYLPPAVRGEIRQRLLALGGLRLTSSIEDNLEINSENAHKGRALEALAERLGLGRESIMAIGDNGNDVTMLEAAGCSVAVADGAAEALRAAKHVAAPHDQWGVAEAIERFILKE